nr:hypothetical protein BaRGS_025875 [Batillaria attramentaria]
MAGLPASLQPVWDLRDRYSLKTVDFLRPQCVLTAEDCVLRQQSRGAPPLLAPIEGFPIPEIDSKSKQFLAKHRLELLDKKRLLQQRQKLSATPVTEVHVTWKDQPGRYWVYGKEQKVYCPDYPEQCACCVIL